MNLKPYFRSLAMVAAVAMLAVGCASTRPVGEQVDDAVITEVKAKRQPIPTSSPSASTSTPSTAGRLPRQRRHRGPARRDRAHRARSTASERAQRIDRALAGTVGTHIDDAAITAAVKLAFAADPEVKALQIDVDTRDGVVTCRAASKPRRRARAPRIWRAAPTASSRCTTS
jgi:hypothetical protein